MEKSISKNRKESLPSATTGLHSLSACCTSSETCTEVNLRSCISRACLCSSRSIRYCKCPQMKQKDPVERYSLRAVPELWLISGTAEAKTSE
jgi:hypothetical protein